MLYVVDCKMNRFSILNTLNNDRFVLTCEEVQTLLTQGKHIENAKLENGEIVPTRGKWSRYGCFDNIYVPVVLFKLEDDLKNLRGYRLFDMMGLVKEYSVEETINLGLQYGLANAKVITNAHSTFISCIGGSFPTLTVRNQRVELKQIVVEVSRRAKKAEGFITVTDRQDKLSRQKIVVEPTKTGIYQDGVVLGKVFNRFLKDCLYDIIDGHRQPSMAKPKGVVIGQTAYYEEGLTPTEYKVIADYLGISFEKLMIKTNTSVYQIKL